MLFGSLRPRCRCGSTQLRRSARRNLREKLLRFLILPWRCENCSRRCYKGSWLRFAKSGGRERLIDQALAYTAEVFDRGTSDLD
jgi:hypothetical protein